MIDAPLSGGASIGGKSWEFPTRFYAPNELIFFLAPPLRLRLPPPCLVSAAERVAGNIFLRTPMDSALFAMMDQRPAQGMPPHLKLAREVEVPAS